RSSGRTDKQSGDHGKSGCAPHEPHDTALPQAFRRRFPLWGNARRRAGPDGYPLRMASRRQIWVGGVPIGGGAPVAVQTMTKTETADYDATMRQIHAVAEAGGDLVRCAVPREKDAEVLARIVKESPIPVIADIHFNYTLA